MKKNAKISKILSLFLAMILIAMTLVSCGSEAGGGETGSAGTSSGAAAGLDASAAAQQGKVVLTMTVHAYTDSFDEDFNALKTELTALGGYIATSDYSYTQASGKRVTATMKIPADKCQEFTDAFSEYLNVTSAKVSSEDITAAYIDVESRIKALETELETVQKMFEEETDYNKVLQMSKHITDLIAELEKSKSLLAEYEKRTAYSTIHLTLTETKDEEEVKEEGFFGRIGSRFTKSFFGVVGFFGDLIVFLIGNLPTLLIIGLVFFGLFRLSKYEKKKREQKRAAAPPPPQTPPPYPPYYGQRPPYPPYTPHKTPPQTPPHTPTENAQNKATPSEEEASE